MSIDVYDVLQPDRLDQKTGSLGKKIKYIKEQSRIHIDPRVVEVFLELADQDPDFIIYLY